MKDKEQLIAQNIGLVHFVIKRFGGKGLDMEELFQVGCVGLCKAVDGFKEERELQFSTYAVPVILGEVKRFMRDNTQVHIRRGIKEQGAKLHYAREQFEKKFHREPTITELADMTGIVKEDVLLATEAMRPVESLDTFVNEEDSGVRKVDLLKSRENAQEQVLNHMLCEEAFRRMNLKEQQLVHMRYFEERTQAQVAQILDMTQVQVSRMEKKILLRLRNEMTKNAHENH